MEARLTKRFVALLLPLSISLALLNGYSSAFEESTQTLSQNSQLKRELENKLEVTPFKRDTGANHGRITTKFTTNVRNSGGYVRKKFDKAKETIGAFIGDKVKPRVMKGKDMLVAFTHNKIKPLYNKVKEKIKNNPTLQSAKITASTKLDAIRKYRSSSKKRVGGTDDKKNEITNARVAATSGSKTKDAQPTDVPPETSRLRQAVQKIKNAQSTAGKHISQFTGGLKSKAANKHETVTSDITGSSKKHAGGTDDKTDRKNENEITNARAGATSGSTTKDSQPTDVPPEASRLHQVVNTFKNGYSTAGKHISQLTDGLKSKATSIHKTVTSHIPGSSKKHAGGTDDKTDRKDENEITNARAGATSGSTTKDSQPTDVPPETSRLHQVVNTIKNGYSTAGKHISQLTDGLKSKATNMYETVTPHIGNAKKKLYDGVTNAKAKVRDTFTTSDSNDKLRRPSPENGSSGQS